MIITRILKKIFFALPTWRRVIVFESKPFFSDNSFALFKELINRKLNKKYRFVWIYYEDIISRKDRIKKMSVYKHDSFMARLYLAKAKFLVSCNGILYSNDKRQISFYLGHGNPFKNTSFYFKKSSIDRLTFFLSSSQTMADLRTSFYGVKKEQLVVLGYPRNDELSQKEINIKKKLGLPDDTKIIAWYPTARQFENSGRVTGSKEPIPIIWNKQSLYDLDKLSREKNVVIMIKPHFAQDVSLVKNLNCTNVILITKDFFEKHHLSSYQFLSGTDALLTDYSSIYHDYTLVDKPIGLIWEDIDEFIDKTGFVDGVDRLLEGGEKIYNINDLEQFVIRISSGVDLLKKKREEIKFLCNYSDDGKNSERVADFFVELLHNC